MEVKTFLTHRLIKSEDLNHHGTLFAGRSAEWFVESGFIAASSLVDAKNVICVKIHGMHFSQPVRIGQTVCFKSKIVYAGRTSLIAYVEVTKLNSTEIKLVDGFLSFVHVDQNTKPTPHGIEVNPVTWEDIQLQEQAKALGKKRE
jgi:acyl-CoA hydrolase